MKACIDVKLFAIYDDGIRLNLWMWLYVEFSVGNDVEIVNKPALQDDPQRRKPNISRAKQFLGWLPKVNIFIHHLSFVVNLGQVCLSEISTGICPAVLCLCRKHSWVLLKINMACV